MQTYRSNAEFMRKHPPSLEPQPVTFSLEEVTQRDTSLRTSRLGNPRKTRAIESGEDGNSVGTPVPKVSCWNCRASDNTRCPGGHANRAERVKYYDDLLERNTELAMKGLPPTGEYKRLDYLTEKLLA